MQSHFRKPDLSSALCLDVPVVKPFELMGYVAARLPGFDFGGEVLFQGAFGLRFDIGLERLDRASAIYDQAFKASDAVVLIGEDGDWESDPKCWYPLFSLPGLIRSVPVPPIASCRVHKPSEEGIRTLTWARLPPGALAARELFEAIANQDHGRSPSVRGRIHVLDPLADVLLHMYDDRGLDIIANTPPPLLLLRKRFPEWVIRDKLGADQPDSMARSHG